MGYIADGRNLYAEAFAFIRSPKIIYTFKHYMQYVRLYLVYWFVERAFVQECFEVCPTVYRKNLAITELSPNYTFQLLINVAGGARNRTTSQLYIVW